MKEELGIRAARLFTPKPWKHTWENAGKSLCKKCNHFCVKGSSCTVPDPIDINWDNAMKLVRAVPYTHVLGQLEGIWEPHIIKNELDLGFERWILYYASSADYIEAACAAKEKSNEAM